MVLLTLRPLPARVALTRTFTTTLPRAVAVPPESPKFLEVPSYGVRPTKTHQERPKGVLPTPRTIIAKSERKYKGRLSYLRRTTPTPTRAAGLAPEGEPRAFQLWKEEMAEKRRQNLQEGLKSIQEQLDEETMRTQALKSLRKTLKKEVLRKEASGKIRGMDEQLTAASIQSALREELFQKGPIPDPNREKRLERMRKNVDEMAKVKKEERKELIQELYFQAGDFIITERQLDRAIEEAFGEDSITEAKRPKMLTSQEMLMEKVGGADRMMTFGSMVKEVDGRVVSALVGKVAQKPPQQFM